MTKIGKLRRKESEELVALLAGLVLLPQLIVSGSVQIATNVFLLYETSIIHGTIRLTLSHITLTVEGVSDQRLEGVFVHRGFQSALTVVCESVELNRGLLSLLAESSENSVRRLIYQHHIVILFDLIISKGILVGIVIVAMGWNFCLSICHIHFVCHDFEGGSTQDSCRIGYRLVVFNCIKME